MPTDNLQRDIALQDLCRFLAACYYEPGPEFVEEGVFRSMATVGSVLGPAFEDAARRLGDAFSAVDQQTLLVDYTRLFLGPIEPRARPYESTWVGREKAGDPEVVRGVEKLYAEAGFDLSPDFRELPDHVAAELEFLYLLRTRENQANVEGDAESIRTVAGLRRRLLTQHLGTWTVPFTAALRLGAETEYYRALADLTAAYVELERRSL